MAKKQTEKFNLSYVSGNFDCGVSDLNQFLLKYALQNQGADSANTYFACENGAVLGFYTLVVGSVIHANAPKRITKGLAKHPVPVMILARLEADNTQHGQGIGRGLLKDALLRTAQASDIAGIRALLVHAKDDAARRWYQQFNFDESPTDSLHLYLLLKDIKKLL